MEHYECDQPGHKATCWDFHHHSTRIKCQSTWIFFGGDAVNDNKINMCNLYNYSLVESCCLRQKYLLGMWVRLGDDFSEASFELDFWMPAWEAKFSVQSQREEPNCPSISQQSITTMWGYYLAANHDAICIQYV